MEDRIFCEYCHKFMQKDSLVDEDGNITYCYSCKSDEDQPCSNKSVRKEWIERKVAEITAESFLTDENIRRLADIADQDKEELEAEKTVCQSQLEEVDAEMRDIVDDMTKGVVSDTKRDRLNDLETQKSELQKRLNKLEFEMRFASSENMTLILNDFKSLDVTELKNQILLIKAFVDYITMRDEAITVYFTYFSECVEVPIPIEERAEFEIDVI
ncbi:MAG: hypothetical protein LIO49_06170 [Ruminococcus sp.]|nr:hypothetical protein [Ruminococcus sp.]